MYTRKYKHSLQTVKLPLLALWGVLGDILSDDEEDPEEPMQEGSDYEFSDLESDDDEYGKYIIDTII